MIELQVPTVALAAEVTCVDGRTFSGRIFVPAAASRHSGVMRPEEWMNEPVAFFPFLPDGAEGPVILDKHQVLVITVAAAEAEAEASEETPVHPERRVIVECGDRRLEGVLRVDMPANQSRVLDYLNRFEIFLSVWEGGRQHLVQKHNISRVLEIREG